MADYIEYCSEITDAPAEFHQFMSLGLVSCMLSNKVYYPFGDMKIFPNLWMLLLAPSSKYRKTTALNIGKRLISRVNPSLIYPNEFSREGILRNMSKQPGGSFFFSEFSALLGMLNRDYMSGTKGFLSDIFDSPDYYERQLTNESFKIEHPAVNIFSATSTDWFLENMKESDVGGGFLARFIIVPSSKKIQDIPLPQMADEQKRSNLLDQLRSFSEINGVCYLKEETRKAHARWYKQFMASMDGGRFDAFMNRLQIYVLKFAMILQISTVGNLKIDEFAIEESIRLVSWLLKKMRTIESEDFTFTKIGKDMRRVINALKNKGDLTRSDLLRSTNLSVRELDQALETLMQKESVESKGKRPENSKKSVTIYKYLKNGIFDET